MNKFNSILKELMAKVAADDSPLADRTKNAVDGAFEFSNKPPAEVANDTASECYKLQVLTATPAEIEYWHACGAYWQLQNLLLQWGLSHFTPYTGYDRFKIGFDFKKNCATFALDSTHYVTVKFVGGRPANRQYAEAVLNYFKDLAQDSAGEQ